MPDLYILIAVLVLLALDVLTTLYTLWRIPGGREGNGVMRWLMDRLGVAPALVLTHVAAGALIWALYRAGGMRPYGEIIAALYGMIVLSNLVGIITGRTLIQRLMGR